MALVLTGFLSYHIYLVLKGTTTNESAKWSEVGTIERVPSGGGGGSFVASCSCFVTWKLDTHTYPFEMKQVGVHVRTRPINKREGT